MSSEISTVDATYLVGCASPNNIDQGISSSSLSNSCHVARAIIVCAALVRHGQDARVTGTEEETR